jgi:hypothetical protein
MMVERHQTARVLEALEDTPAVMVAGPRQVGKSTLAHAVATRFGSGSAVTLDNVPTRNAAIADPDGFVRGLKLPATIDELQRAPDLLYGIKQVIDERRLAGQPVHGSFLLTGSTGIWDTLASPESLAGRIERVRMWPFSQGELAGRRESFIDALFADDPPRLTDAPLGREPIARAVVLGGFPEVQERSERRTQHWFAEYLARVLDRDIRELADVRRPDHLPALLRLCATRVGGPVNVDGMIADLGVSKSTGRRYYELLRRVYLRPRRARRAVPPGVAARSPTGGAATYAVVRRRCSESWPWSCSSVCGLSTAGFPFAWGRSSTRSNRLSRRSTRSRSRMSSASR